MPGDIRRVGSLTRLDLYGRGLAVVAEESARRGKVHDKMVRVVFGLVGAEDSAGRYRVGDERGKGIGEVDASFPPGSEDEESVAGEYSELRCDSDREGPFRFGGTVLKEAAGGRIPPERCYQCLEKCDPSSTPYCITAALVNAAEGDLDHALLFCGSNACRAEKIETVEEVMADLMGER